MYEDDEDEQEKAMQAEYEALVVIRDKAWDTYKALNDHIRQHPAHVEPTFCISEKGQAEFERRELLANMTDGERADFEWLERLYGQVGKEAVGQDKEHPEKIEKASGWGLSNKSDEELIVRFNREVGCSGWVSTRGRYLAELHDEFEKRFDYSAIGDTSSLSFARKIKLVGKKIVPFNSRSKGKNEEEPMAVIIIEVKHPSHCPVCAGSLVASKHPDPPGGLVLYCLTVISP